MKLVESKVHYTVPNWNFCNSDNLINGGELTTNTCRFCIKDKHGAHCLLYDKTLTTEGKLINKVRACCKATAGFPSEISPEPQTPIIPPKEIMKQTIEIYSKTLNDLINQGYPRQMAEQAAKKYILGNK